MYLLFIQFSLKLWLSCIIDYDTLFDSGKLQIQIKFIDKQRFAGKINN